MLNYLLMDSRVQTSRTFFMDVIYRRIFTWPRSGISTVGLKEQFEL